jgi:nitroreductase
MTFFETVQARQSIRAYQDRAVEAEKLEAILAAVNRAPSAGNRQAYQVFVVRDGFLKQGLARAALDQEFLAQAPLVLVYCAAPVRSDRYGERGLSLYCQQDTAIGAAYAQLAATAEGLGTCWVGAFNEDTVATLLELPAGLRPVVLMPIGYANEMPPPTTRRPVTELVHEVPPPA